MTYRGVYRDGIVVLQGDVDLRNGEPVDVNSTRGKRYKSKTIKKAKSPVGKRRGAKDVAPVAGAKPRPSVKDKSGKSAEHPLPGFGAWKHRTDIVDSAAFATGVRKRTSRR